MVSHLRDALVKLNHEDNYGKEKSRAGTGNGHG
jgi:hypothetical protein